MGLDIFVPQNSPPTKINLLEGLVMATSPYSPLGALSQQRADGTELAGYREWHQKRSEQNRPAQRRAAESAAYQRWLQVRSLQNRTAPTRAAGK